MKKIILICSLLVSQFALADGPRVEPGPVMKFGSEASAIAHILLSRQLTKCVAEFQQYDVAGITVVAQHLTPGHSRYQISGVVLEGGDMARGQIVLNINETEQQSGFGFGKVRIYSCDVSIK